MDDRDLLRARIATFAALVLVLGFYLFVQAPWNWLISGIVAVLTAGLLTAVLDIWLRLSLRRAAGGQRFIETRQQLEESQSQVRVVFDLQKKFLEAHSEKEILEAVVQVGGEALHASGASFVPYDEWGQSLPAVIHGKVPAPALQSWAQRLSSPETRQTCKNCKALHGAPGCVLIPAEVEGPTQVLCFPLSCDEREVGVVNFYFDVTPVEPGTELRTFMQELLHSAGYAIQNLRSRDQEIAALLYLQTAAMPKADLSILLGSLLENVQRALDVDFALFYLPHGIPGQINSSAQLFVHERNDGKPGSPLPEPPFLDGIWKSVQASGHSLSLENVTLNKREMWKVLLAVPLVWQDQSPTGMLVLGSNSIQAFAHRHQQLLETLAGQAALLIQNAWLMMQVEYQAVVDERTRLAREIHDGLAQTLAFLKIQSAQMQNYLARGEMDRLTNTLQASYRTLSDAYIDARQAIDNLRRVPSASLRDWVGQVAADYEESTGQKVDLSLFQLQLDYPPNVQAQLIRILQEALSNVRKHSGAQSVAIVGRQDGNTVLIEIRDNGKGFSPEQVDGNSRYGLRGMRERAESIGADFQIISQPGAGAVICLRLPVVVKEES